MRKHIAIFAAALGLAACSSGVNTACEGTLCMHTFRDAHGGVFGPIVTGEVFTQNGAVVGTEAQATESPAVSAIGPAIIGGALYGAAGALGPVGTTINASVP